MNLWTYLDRKRRLHFDLLHIDRFVDTAQIEIDLFILPYYIWKNLWVQLR